MTRKFLMGIIILLIITNLTTVAVWMNDRNNSGEMKRLDNENKQDIVALIGKNKITYQSWQTELEKNYGEKVLKELIDREVVANLAEQENIEVSDKLIDREISLLFTMQGILNEEEETNMEQTWRNEITHRYQLEELLTKDINITETEIREYYDNYKNQYEFKESIQVSHILVDDRDTAEKVYDELESGANFASLAREYSIEEQATREGGYLGYYTRESEFLPDEYYTIAVELDEDSYSKPFLGGSGVAIVYLHRLLPTINFTYDELKPQIRRELALEKVDSTVSADMLWDNFDIEWIYE